jgi:Carboxypeptidase regulatory-like domain
VRYHTAIVELTDADPATEPGQIRGKVLEGPRTQPGLEIILRDGKGVELRRTKTKADGSFLFEDVPPGSYVIFCSKPDSRRRATVPAVVQPNRATVRDVELVL